jgi:hypothetical protein
VRNWRQRFSLALGCVLIPALGTLAYALLLKASLWAIIHRAISYDWGIGVWGYTYYSVNYETYICDGVEYPQIWANEVIIGPHIQPAGYFSNPAKLKNQP